MEKIPLKHNFIVFEFFSGIGGMVFLAFL